MGKHNLQDLIQIVNSSYDPIAMATYEIGILPILSAISNDDIKQVAFADDISRAGTITTLKHRWDKICDIGPLLGYYQNASKSWIIVKEMAVTTSYEIFKDSGVNITITGKRHLGAVIGTLKFKEEYVNDTVKSWVDQLEVLSDIAKSYPQEAYSVFVSGFINKFTYDIRTIKDISNLLIPVENVIRYKFITNTVKTRI